MFSQTPMPAIMNTMGAGGAATAASRVQALEAKLRAFEGAGKAKSSAETADFQTSLTSASQTVSGSFDLKGSSAQERFAKLQPLVQEYCQKYDMNPRLVNALIRQESGFNPQAVSKAGAQGLMQLMPQTAKGLGVENPMDPAQNLEGGIRYLKSKLDQYNGNVILALASYNAGSGAVKKYGGVPPYAETQNYVKSILKNYLGPTS